MQAAANLPTPAHVRPARRETGRSHRITVLSRITSALHNYSTDLAGAVTDVVSKEAVSGHERLRKLPV